MAAPAYATDLTTFWLESATTVTAIGTGGAGLGNPETDFFIQGGECISKAAWVNAIKGFIIDALGTTFTVPTDGAVIAFAKYDAQGSLDTQALGGLRMIFGSSASAYDHYYVAGSDTIEFNSWIPYAIDPNTATPDTTTGSPDGTERWVGILGDLPTTSGPTKGSPIAIDAIRYGRCTIEYTIGEVADPATFDGAELAGNVNSTRWGLLELQQGAFQTQGFHSIGLSGTAVYFSDSDKVLFWRKQLNNLTDDAISTAFNRVEILNSGTVCEWTNIIWQALGARSRGTFVHTAGTFDAALCQFIDWDTFTFIAASVVTDSTFRRCNAITAPGMSLLGSSVLGSTVAANASALIWDANVDPNSKMDGMTYEMGAASSHAIEFGLTSPLTMTLTDVDFSGYNTTTDNQNDSTLHIKRTSGTVTINISGTGTVAGDITYRSDGATVVIQQQVTMTFDKMKDNSEVRVYAAGTTTELAGIENATAGSPDNRSFGASISAGTNVDYTIVSEQYEIIRVESFTWPSVNQTLDINQRFDRNQNI